jgi:hypothetical protein
MIASEKYRDLQPTSRQSARLRLVGVIVLLLGLGSAGTVYWVGIHSPDSTLGDDPAMLGFNRVEQRQMALLYGKMGALVEGWSDDLKRPGVQATLIILLSVVIAASCFFFARRLDIEVEPDHGPSAVPPE